MYYFFSWLCLFLHFLYLNFLLYTGPIVMILGILYNPLFINIFLLLGFFFHYFFFLFSLLHFHLLWLRKPLFPLSSFRFHFSFSCVLKRILHLSLFCFTKALYFSPIIFPFPVPGILAHKLVSFHNEWEQKWISHASILFQHVLWGSIEISIGKSARSRFWPNAIDRNFTIVYLEDREFSILFW